jgi:hypothetical protein
MTNCLGLALISSVPFDGDQITFDIDLSEADTQTIGVRARVNQESPRDLGFSDHVYDALDDLEEEFRGSGEVPTHLIGAIDRSGEISVDVRYR